MGEEFLYVGERPPYPTADEQINAAVAIVCEAAWFSDQQIRQTFLERVAGRFLSQPVVLPSSLGNPCPLATHLDAIALYQAYGLEGLRLLQAARCKTSCPPGDIIADEKIPFPAAELDRFTRELPRNCVMRRIVELSIEIKGKQLTGCQQL
jgi:hypothetical protein